MSIPTWDQLIAAGQALITWGFWIIVYGVITMLIGLVIIGSVAILNNKKVVKFIK